FVIVVICCFSGTGNEGPKVRNPRLNLMEVLDGSLIPRRFNGTWISEKELIYRDFDGTLILYNAETLNKTVLMLNTAFRLYDVHSYSLSADRKYVLLAYAIRKRFRYSYTAKYKYFDIQNYQTSPLLPSEDNAELQYVSWGPTGSQLVYVRNNDIYYMAYVGDIPPKRITRSGVDQAIFNGIPDWVYEEEILGNNNPIWWSEDGTRLCFASFDDSLVPEVQYPWYGDYMDENNIYPAIVKIRYPKPGTENPIATLWVVDVTFTSSIPAPRSLRPPKEIQEREHYFTQVKWIDRSRIAAVWLRRSQNFSVVSICHERKGWACETNLEEVSSTGWVDMYEPLVFTSDKKYYFIRLPANEGDAGKFRHVAMVSIEDKRRKFLTQGAYDVVQILAHRQDVRKTYYISTLPNNSGQRHLFISMLDNNDAVRELYQKRALPQVRTFQVPVEGGFNANVQLLLPPGLKDDEITQYPMIVFVYAGPGQQLVTERFEIHWGTYLASRKNFIYATIDGRGSGNRGDRILHQIYKKLGSVEIEDQMVVSRYLKNDLPFIDPEKIAIWGWSYGGYAAAMALATDTGVFKCGISVAPVTSWRYYDSVYTERYMQFPSPEQNYLAYERSSLLKKVANIKGTKFLLVHGTNDDNVHLQQSMILMKALTDAGVLFQTQIYPDESHNLAHVPSHFYQTMEAFLDQCFDIPRKEDIGLQKTSKKVFIGGR
ncbi:dipeptidyl peptidase 4-like, partial [Limulus polyphemus]|uniref:Dipeptidyl peptidase 4-like n=1 Tax=Limulus polyphemus TaxID=6850 RepID=A0ABM1B2J7_LIMPO